MVDDLRFTLTARVYVCALHHSLVIIASGFRRSKKMRLAPIENFCELRLCIKI